MNCPHCDQEFVFTPGWTYCSFCGKTLFSDDLPQTDVESEEDAGGGPAHAMFSADFGKFPCSWEDPRESRFFRSLLDTVHDSALSPKRFFSTMSVEGGYLLPILYAVIIQMAATAARLLGTAVFGVSSVAGSLGAGATSWGAAVLPAATALGLLVWALALHGALMILQGRREAFHATLRVVCYSATPELLGAIPLAGEIVGLVWKFVLTLIGVMAIHRVGAIKAFAAITAPIIAIVSLALVVVLFGLAAALYR